MPMIIEMFPPVVLALNEEVKNHPLLLATLETAQPQSLEEVLGHVAAYCNVGLDGYYMEEDIEALFVLLLNRLKIKSTIHIN